MTFSSLIDGVRARGDILELPVDSPPLADDIQTFFETHNVDIRQREPSEPAATVGQEPRQEQRQDQVVLYRDGEPIARDPIDRFLTYAQTTDPDSTDVTTPDVIAEAATTIVQLTDATRPRMLEGSRQIEKLAWRARSGTIHAGFQRLSVFDDHEPTERLYRQLARSDVDVHIYGRPDAEIETGPGLTVHGDTSEAITSTWFIAYTTAAGPQAALIAQEQTPALYTGFWTFMPAVAADVVSAIESDLLPTA